MELKLDKRGQGVQWSTISVVILAWIGLVLNEKETKKLEGARSGKRRWVNIFQSMGKKLVVNVLVGEKGTCWLNKHNFE